MTYDRKLARRNIEITIERSKQALAEPDPEDQAFPNTRASITRALAEARGALAALNDGENPQGWA